MNYQHSKSNIISFFFVIAGIFSIFLNYEFSIFEIATEGKRIRNSFNILTDQGNIINYTSLNIPINLFDIISTLLFIKIFFFKREQFFYYISSILNNTFQRKNINYFSTLFIYILLVLIFKKSNFLNSINLLSNFSIFSNYFNVFYSFFA